MMAWDNPTLSLQKCRSQRADTTVAIVRAATNAGTALVDGFAARSSKVLLIDHEPDAARCRQVPQIGAQREYRLDMGVIGQWRQIADDLARRLEQIDLLIIITGSDSRGVAPVTDSPYDWLDAAAYREFLHDAGSAAVSSIFELLPAVAATQGTVVVVAPNAAMTDAVSNPLATMFGFGLYGMVAGLAAPLHDLSVRIAALLSIDGRLPETGTLMRMIDCILATGKTGKCWTAERFSSGGELQDAFPSLSARQ